MTHSCGNRGVRRVKRHAVDELKFLPHTEGMEGACYSTPKMVVKRMRREMQKAGGGSPEHATKVPHDQCMTAHEAIDADCRLLWDGR